MTDGNNGYDAVPTTTLFADTPEFIAHYTKVKEWKDKGTRSATGMYSGKRGGSAASMSGRHT